MIKIRADPLVVECGNFGHCRNTSISSGASDLDAVWLVDVHDQLVLQAISSQLLRFL